METCFKILQFKYGQNLSNRCIGLTLKISPSTVYEVLFRFKTTSLPWPLPDSITPAHLEKLIFPVKTTTHPELVPPDSLYIDVEIGRPGVTRQLLWLEYKTLFGNHALGYSKFCRCYRAWKATQRLSMRQEHRAGEKLFIDFCGPTVSIISPETGKIRRVAIFVAVMRASNYTYAEACEGQDMMSWLNANSRCLTFLGAYTGKVVESLLKRKAHPKQAYRAVLGLIALQNKYGRERLEKACHVAWHHKMPDRRFIENLLHHQRENQELQAMRGGETHPTASLEHENLRGPGYYH
ncbi:transposase [Citrobacter sp. S-77]|uniref:transposase n=1 Tax=Citrobacter sp. S-77 TaxID=1080067 RepID=UPI0005EF9FD8|nr:transposase [Citrobacter sp. S-77]